MLREMVGFVQYYEARSESIRDLVKALPGGGDSVMPISDSGLYYLPRAGPLAPLAAQAACARLQLAAARQRDIAWSVCTPSLWQHSKRGPVRDAGASIDAGIEGPDDAAGAKYCAGGVGQYCE